MIVTGSSLLGPADSPRDYQALTSGWGVGAAFFDSLDLGPFNLARRTILQHEQAYGEPVVSARGSGAYAFRPGTETPFLDPDEANRRYGVPGHLSWDKPVREGEAKLLNAWKRDELARADKLARAESGFLPGSARFLAGLAGANVDPLGFASNFVPVLQEARWAQLAGNIGLRPARFLRGAVEGVAGSALTTPLTLMQSQNQQGEYDAYDAALDFAFGAVGGAGLHVLGGEAGDLLKRWRSSPIALRDAALNQAASALVTGTPVRTAEIMATVEAPETLKAAALKVGDQVFTGPTHGDAYEAAIAAGIPEDALTLGARDSGFVTSTGRYVGRQEATDLVRASGQKARIRDGAVTSQGTTAPTAEELQKYSSAPSEAKQNQTTNLEFDRAQDALTFVMSKGGIRDTEGHDLRNAVGQRSNPRYGSLIREKGNTIDEIGEMLHEAGYFGDPRTSPRPTEAQVVDLLREAAGRKVYSELANVSSDIDAGRARDLANEDLGRVAEETGVTISEVERSAALDLMMGQGLSASDALDEVLERTSIEGGTFATTAQRVADVERRIAALVEAGAPLTEIAPLMDERAALQADLARERLPQVGETIRADLRGDTPGSLDAMGREGSRIAEQAAKEALPPEGEISPSSALEQARAARMQAEANYRALSGGADLEGSELAALQADLEVMQAKRQAALGLAGCMIREGL